jgi:multidrug resistance protein, MATE family
VSFNLKWDIKSLLFFSLPSILSSLLEPIASTIDTVLVGNLNTQWLGALAIATIIINSISWIFNFLVHTSTQSVASSFSEDKFRLTVGRIQVSVALACIIGALLTLLLYIFRFNLYSIAGSSNEIVSFVDNYFSVRLIGHPFSVLFITLISIQRGLRQIKSVLVIISITTIINFLISWVLLYVFKFGVEGAAIGSIFSHFVGVFLSLSCILKHSKLHNFFDFSYFSKSEWIKFGENSWHLFGRSFLLTSTFFISTRLASSQSVIHLAAHQIILQIWLLSSFLIDGLAITANVLGAGMFASKNKHEVQLLTTNMMKISGAIGVLFTFIYYFAEDFILNVFTNDDAVIEQISIIWWVIYSFQIINSWAFILDGILFGGGDFQYLKGMMLKGVIFIFAPILILGSYYKFTLLGIWLGLVGLSIFRAINGAVRVKYLIARLV